MEEFRKPLEYIVRLHSEGLVDDAGICKIVPPKGWKCPKPKLKCDVTFPTKLQQLRHLQEGRLFRDGKKYNLPGYKAMADRYRAAELDKDVDPAQIGGNLATAALMGSTPRGEVGAAPRPFFSRAQEKTKTTALPDWLRDPDCGD